MLKKESFFQYLFVQSLGYSNTKFNKFTNSNPLDTLQNNFAESRQTLDSKSHLETLKPLKLKTVKSQKYLILFTKNKITKTKPNYRVKFNGASQDAPAANSFCSQQSSEQTSNFFKAGSYLSNSNIDKMTQSFSWSTSMPANMTSQVLTRKLLPTLKNKTGIKKRVAFRGVETLAQDKSQSILKNVDAQPSKNRSHFNRAIPLKFSQKIFLFNKELKKAYIPTNDKLVSSKIAKKDIVQQKSLTNGQKYFKKEKNKEPSYNVFLTYKKSFLSYWLLPFFGLISLTGSSSSWGNDSNLENTVNAQRAATVYNKITEGSHGRIFKNLSIEAGKTKTDQYLNWQSRSDVETIDSFYSLSFYTQKQMERLYPASLANKTLRMEMFKSLFFKVFNLTFNPNLGLSTLSLDGLSVNIIKPQTEKNKLASQINFHTINFAFLKNRLLKQNTFDFNWYDFFLKNGMGQNPSCVSSDPANSFNNLQSIPEGHRNASRSENIHSQNNTLQGSFTNIEGKASNNGYYFPNKLLCSLALSNNATSGPFGPRLENYKKLLSTEYSQQSDGLPSISLASKFPSLQKELNFNPSSSNYLTWNLKNQQNTKSNLFNQVDNFPLNGTLIGISSLNKKTKNKVWGFNKNASRFLLPFKNKTGPFSTQQTKNLNVFQAKNNSKTTHLTWSTIKAKYTKLLDNKNEITWGKASASRKVTQQIKRNGCLDLRYSWQQSGQAKVNIQLTPEKSLKKALFLLDSVWLNSLWSSVNNKALETPWKNSRGPKGLDVAFTAEKSNTWCLDDSVLFCLRQSPSWQQSSPAKANTNILNNLQALNDNIVFILKTKSKENTKITALEKGKVLSINNRNILYTCIFDGLKNDLNHIIACGFDPFKNKTGHPSVAMSMPFGHRQQKSLLEGYKATQHQTIKKLNRPLFGGTLALDNSLWTSTNVFSPQSSEQLSKGDNQISLMSEIDTCMPEGHTAGSKAAKQQSLNHSSCNNLNPQKNVTKLNFKISNLPITLVAENLSFTNLTYSKNTLLTQENKNQSTLLQHFSSSQTPVAKNSLRKKSIDESFVLFGNYLNTITTKIKTGFLHSKPVSNSRGPSGLNVAFTKSSYEQSMPEGHRHGSIKHFCTKVIKGAFDPYLSNLGNYFLWDSARQQSAYLVQSQLSLQKGSLIGSKGLLTQANNENSQRLSGVDITIKKLINKTTLPKFERIFLSYLSQSKLGEKNKLNLGLGSTSLDKLKQKTLKKTIKQMATFNQSLVKPELIQLPVKIKNIAKNELLLKKTADRKGIQQKSVFVNGAVLKNKQKKSLLGVSIKKRQSLKKSIFRKSFTVLLKNRLFVNKKQNAEFWGPLMITDHVKATSISQEQKGINPSLFNDSNVMLRTTKIINENRRKKQQIKLKRRLKKMQCATRRRKKRKIFYPRPKWLTFTMYENFLNSRFTDFDRSAYWHQKGVINQNLTTNQRLNLTKLDLLSAKPQLTPKLLRLLTKKSSLNTKGLATIITGKSWDMLKKREAFFKSKDFYNISPTVSRDLRRILMKSNWLRNYLNPYLEKIKYIYKEMEKDSKRVDIFFKLKGFINTLYGSNFLANAEVNQLVNFTNNEAEHISKRYWLNMNIGLPTSTDTKNTYGLIDLYKLNGTILNFEYNRILYQRIQRIILNIRENLNLNGQLKHRSQKLGKNIRPFIKRDYIKRDNPLTGNQNENIFSKNLKKTLLNFRRNFIMINNGYEEPSIYTTETLSPLVRNNFYWALNRTEKVLTSNPNSSYIKNLWEKYKIREINKNNKTKKMLFSLVQKYQDLLSDHNILDTFNNNLEPDFIQTNKFYKQKTPSITEDHKAINEPPMPEGHRQSTLMSEESLSSKAINDPHSSSPAYNFIYETSIANAYKNMVGDSVLSDNKTLLNLENLTNRNYQNSQETNSRNIKNSQAKIKRNLLATKNYIDKIEKKLINVENKLKLLGLASTNNLKPSSLYNTMAISGALSETSTKPRISSLTRINSLSLSAQKLFDSLIDNQQLKKQTKTIFKPMRFRGEAANLEKSKFNPSHPEYYNPKDVVRITSLKYKKAYFRFLKQKLFKEKEFFVPYAPFKIEKGKLKQMSMLEGQKINTGRKSLALQSIARDEIPAGLFAAKQPFYLEKIEKLFYAIKQQTLSEIIASQNNLSGIKLTSHIQNYNKFSSTTYWWTKVPMLQKNSMHFDSLPSNQTNSNIFNRKSEKLLIPSQNISISLVSILFHFCAIITLVSLGAVRNVVKFYYILISKLYKVINTIRFAKIFPTKVQKSTFNVPKVNSLQEYSIPVGQRSPNLNGVVDRDKISLYPKGIDGAWRLSKYIRNTQLLDQEKSQSLSANKISIANSMRNGHKNLLTSFKRIKFISLKYLLVRENLADQVYMSRSNVDIVENTNLLNVSNSMMLLMPERSKDQTSISASNISTLVGDTNINITNSLKGYVDARRASTKNSNLLLLKSKRPFIDLVNFYLQSKSSSQKRSEYIGAQKASTSKLLARGGAAGNRIKVEVLYDTNKNLSLSLNIIHKVSFYTYLLMLKSVDVLIAPAYLIYKFFEKPGEYVVENLAYSFLLEWSADLISTIPDSIDPALANYYMKLQRNLPLYLFLNPRNINIGLIGQKTIYNLLPSSKEGTNLEFKTVNTSLYSKSIDGYFEYGYSNNNFLNGGLKSLARGFAAAMESIFGVFVLSIQNSILKRFTNSTLLLFTQQITEPDTDFINRQKKGIIFWDLWGESLKTIAEKNAVNIYELSTDKEEQLKLLSNMQNSNLLNKSANTFMLARYVGVGNPFMSHNMGASKAVTDFFGYSYTSNKKSNKSYLVQDALLSRKASLFESQRWAVNQFLNYQGKDTELFIDMHPPRTFANTATALKYAFAIQAPIGSIVCQIFGGIFYKQISKNILVVLHNSSQTNKGLEKSLLIQAIAGETELKIITDNAHRYAMVVQGVAVGIKLLKDVFEALCATGPCIFLLEDIHAIGERRPFLIDEASPNLTESIYNKNQSMQAFLLKEKSSASREILYKTNKHLLTNYKKPYKEFKSLASNHFSFNFLYRASSITKRRPVDINTTEVPLSIQVNQKDKETQDSNLDKKSNFDGTGSSDGNGSVISNTNNILNKRYISESNSQKSNSSNKVYGSFSQLINSIKNKQSLINPPASSPFNLLLMKESTKLKPNQIVNEMAWFGLPGEQYSLISKYNYSIRIKVALLADSVLSNLSVKLEMITDLLVIIDSVKGNRGFIIFATTHLPDILDPALRRPGRFDETLSLPFIPSLYSRWTNYRYNLQFLNTSLVKHYSIPFNSTFNKGTTLDFLKLPISYSNSQMEALFPIYNSMKSFGRIARLKTQNSLYLDSSQYKQNSLVWQANYDYPLLVDKPSTDFSYNKGLKERFKALTNVMSIPKGHRLIKYKSTYLSYLVKDYLRFSYSHAASYASKAILSLMLCLCPSNSDLYIANNTSNKFNNNSSNKNLPLDLKNKEKIVQTVLKWPTMLRLCPSGIDLKDSNIFENYSNYLSLFAPTYFNKTSFGQMLLLSFITYKIGETFGFTTRKTKLSYPNTSSSETESVLVKSSQKGSIDSQKAYQATKNKKTKKTVKNPFVLNFNKNSEWKKGPSLLYSYLQKRLPQLSVTEGRRTSTNSWGEPSVNSKTVQQQQIRQNFNYSTFYSTQLLNFNNNYSLMEPPSPPITNILLPAKRYENYRRSFKNLYNLNSNLDTVSEKLKLHQQQRLLKRLYNYPIKEFFRNEKFSWWFSQNYLKSISSPKGDTSNSRLTEKSSFATGQIINKNNLKTFKPVGFKNKINFAQSYFTFAGIENFAQKNMASLNKFSSIDYSYRNILYNRHKTYLTNQWWNGQQGEHNLESTFLSDIDWRYTQLSNTRSNLSSHDIQIDFPDCDQFYNPRNRRWILTTGDWNYWFSLEADLNNIYSHYIYESFTKAYKTIDQNREILDFYSAKLLRTSFNLLNLVESLDAKSLDVASVIMSIAEEQKNKNVFSSFTTSDTRLMTVDSIAKDSKRTISKINATPTASRGLNISFDDLTHREILNLYKRFFYSSALK
jgi:SpoVK/Ycf46/Vps4 family AAA+-type ATPase